MAILTYPKILEAAEWDKKKGVIAKLAVETGIGKALTELKGLFTALDQEKLHVGGYAKPHSHADIDGFMEQAKTHYKARYVPFQAKCLAVKALALQAQAKFKKNKLIPKADEEYVGKIATAADILGLQSKNNDEEFASYAQEKVLFDKRNAVVKGALKTYVANLEAAVKDCLKEPTGANWVSLVTQKNRSVGNALGNVPELKAKYWGTWQKLDGLQATSQSSPAEVKAECEKLLREIGKLKGDVG